MSNSPFFVFDVESVGLHGEGYAVGICVVSPGGEILAEDRYACDPESARGMESDREWIAANVPEVPVSHRTPREVREAFWMLWMEWKETKGATMAADCLWPVEARFVCACVDDRPERRAFLGPYPFLEISSVLTAAGIDPLANYPRLESEEPKHDPLADARQSARLLTEALAHTTTAAQ